MKIAIDAMGGDLYPASPVRGAIQAVNDNGVEVVLVGDEPSIKKVLDDCKYDPRKVEIVHTTQVVGMDEAVASALRSKRKSSMRVCYNLHKKGEVDGIVSAGNSGAMLALGHFVLKPIAGIDRPCISALLPSLKEKVLLLDAGANMDCTPEHLLQFAILGHVYMKFIHSIKNPRVGLLNIGSEEGKGDERSKQTYDLLKKSTLNFVGNIEGKEFFNGDIDVVVTDGFAGNVLLKSVQGAAKYISTILKEEINKSFLSKIGAMFMQPAFKGLKKRTHYAEFGGAPLLGLRGVSVVCHGSSSPDAIQFGINFAKWAADAQLGERIEKEISEYKDILHTI